MMKFFRKNNKIIFMVLTPMLAVGLVLSFTIWSSPTMNTSNQGQRGQGAPVQQDDKVVEMLTNIRRYEQALKNNPDNYSMLVDLGNGTYDIGELYSKQQQNDKAITYFTKATEAYKKALEIGEPNANIATDLATAAMYSGQYDLAEEYFQVAMETDKNHVVSRMNYGVFLMNIRQDNAGAVKQWEDVLALNPDPSIKSNAQQLIQQAQTK